MEAIKAKRPIQPGHYDLGRPLAKWLMPVAFRRLIVHQWSFWSVPRADRLTRINGMDDHNHLMGFGQGIPSNKIGV